MKPFICVTLLSLLLHVCAWAQPQADKPKQTGNAAMKYWQAIALLPSMDEKQEKLLENWKTIPLDAETNRLLESTQASLNYMKRAAACPQCHWDLDYVDGPGLLLPHLAKCRTLGRIAALQIRSEFAAGKPAAAVDTFLALLTLARHTGNEPIVISILVGYAIESFAWEAIAPYLPDLDKELISKLISSVASLPAMVQMQQTLSTEKVYMCEWLLKKMEAAEKQLPGGWRKVLLSMLDSTSKEDESNQKMLSSIDTFAKARKLANELMPVYDELVQVFQLPYTEQAGRFDELIKQANKNNPLSTILLPALNKILAAQNRYQAKLALFQAALAVVQKGPEQLKTITDPFGTGPFEYKQLPQGFVLTSKLRSTDGKPISFTAGN